ncbi:MAG: hypothetical protein ACOCP8_07280 [archaeon]
MNHNRCNKKENRTFQIHSTDFKKNGKFDLNKYKRSLATMRCQIDNLIIGIIAIITGISFGTWIGDIISSDTIFLNIIGFILSIEGTIISYIAIKFISYPSNDVAKALNLKKRIKKCPKSIIKKAKKIYPKDWRRAAIKCNENHTHGDCILCS